MTRISVVQLFVALAVLALALAQTVTTTVTVAGTAYIEEIVTDELGLITTQTLDSVILTPLAGATSSSSINDGLYTPDPVVPVVTLSSSSRSSRSSSTLVGGVLTPTTTDDLLTPTDDVLTPVVTTTRTTTTAPPVANVSPTPVPAGSIMGADQYSQQVSAHQASMYAAYLGSLSAAGIDPAKATNGVVNAATAVQASAAMILVGVVAAVLV